MNLTAEQIFRMIREERLAALVRQWRENRRAS